MIAATVAAVAAAAAAAARPPPSPPPSAPPPPLPQPPSPPRPRRRCHLRPPLLSLLPDPPAPALASLPPPAPSPPTPPSPPPLPSPPPPLPSPPPPPPRCPHHPRSATALSPQPPPALAIPAATNAPLGATLTGSPFVPGGLCSAEFCANGTSVINFKITWFLVYIHGAPPPPGLSHSPGGGGALLRVEYRIPGRHRCVATFQACSVSGMRRDCLPGAHRTPHARSGQARCQNRKRIRRGRAEEARDHIPVN